MAKIDTSKWKEFKISSIFHVQKGTGFGLKKLQEGNTPLISATTKNNSIVAYSNVPIRFPQNTITVTTDGAGMGYATVQDAPFDIASNAVALIPKINNIGLYAKFFVCGIIRQYANHFSYTNKLNKEQLSKLFVKLPAITPPRLGIFGKYYQRNYGWRCH